MPCDVCSRRLTENIQGIHKGVAPVDQNGEGMGVAGGEECQKGSHKCMVNLHVHFYIDELKGTLLYPGQPLPRYYNINIRSHY